MTGAARVASDGGHLRSARPADLDQLVALWALLFDEGAPAPGATWPQQARQWFEHAVLDAASAKFPVVEAGGTIVATAIGTLEIGVPNPYCPHGRAVRLANVITLPPYRGRGFGEAVTRDVVEWARSIGADRVDLSATPDGQRLYERLGFEPTSAQRMKLEL